MKMISATIVRNQEGSDHVSIETDLKDGCWPYTAPLYLNFRVAKGQTEPYMEINFPGLPLRIVDVTKERQ